jgi:hypothetical protein
MLGFVGGVIGAYLQSRSNTRLEEAKFSKLP